MQNVYIAGQVQTLLFFLNRQIMAYRRLVSIAFKLLLFLPLQAAPDIMFWNLENFFDYFDDGYSSSDRDFSSFGPKHWTKARFGKKCNMVGKTVLWAGNMCPDGHPPEIVGFAEVENAFVMHKIAGSDILRKSGYSIIHFESHDRRGIDVALMYMRDSLELIASRAFPIPDGEGGIMATRDILYAALRDSEGKTVHVLVNHHPSKFGGAAASRKKRDCAMQRLSEICDSLISLSSGPVVAMGDFNDVPSASQFDLIGNMRNLAMPLHAKGEGTIRFRGKWELIDHFLVSSGGMSAESEADSVSSSASCPGSAAVSSAGSVADSASGSFSAPAVANYRMSILRPPFLLEKDNAHTGEKPFRAYSGPRYLGGVSDHLPILLTSASGNM